MTPVRPFTVEGSVALVPVIGHYVLFRNISEVQAGLRGYHIGDQVDVEIRPHEDTRRAQAHRYLFGVVYTLIERETGQSKDSIHEAMKARFLVKTVTRFVNYQTGEIIEERVVESSQIQTVSAFFAFTENVRLWAQEWLGLYTPDPDPDYRVKRRKKVA